MSVDEALATIAETLSPRTPHTIGVDATALGAICASPVMCSLDTPRFDCSAMDGFALRSMDTADALPTSPLTLSVTTDIPAQAVVGTVASAAAARISTGAFLPCGTDAVISQERVRIGDGLIELDGPVIPGLNVRRQGEDARRGDLILRPGSRIGFREIGALLAFGIRSVIAHRASRIRFVPTGSEFCASSSRRDLDGRYDSNGPMLLAFCRELGVPAMLEAPVPDDGAALAEALLPKPGQSEDIIATIGGASAGPHDQVRRTVEKLGGTILIDGVAMRPGKPLIFATLPDGRTLFGLPGNPVAALVGFRFFMFSAIRRQMGLPPESGQSIDPLGEARQGLSLFLRAKSPSQGRRLSIALDQRSHIMHSLLETDIWVRLDHDQDGATARAFPFHPLLS